MSVILGLNAYHGDSAACLVYDGEIIAAAEEERFRRIKHWAGFPSEAIRFCLQEAGIALCDVEFVALNSAPNANILRKMKFVFQQRTNLNFVIERIRNQTKRHSIEKELSSAFPGQLFQGKIRRIEHHIAHLSSAFLVSPFKDAIIASIDGFGDFSSAAWGVGHGTSIRIDERVHFPHSLGVFYQALTQYLGFPHYGDEYKVMGLAPYGQPSFLDKMHRIVQLEAAGRFKLDTSFFRHHREKVDYAWEGGRPHVGTLYSSALEELLGPARSSDEPIEQKHRDLARSVQAMYEEAFFHLINHLFDRHRLDTLALAGGCAMNSVANGKVLRQSPVKRLYVQAAAGDAGGAIGAAVYVWHQENNSENISGDLSAPQSALPDDKVRGRRIMDHAYLGPAASDEEIHSLLVKRGLQIEESSCNVEKIFDEFELCRRAAKSISQGDVVGWFQGRMEWGPRALGNRSIICDPRRADMKNILNLKIKRRESFRPFAPSILKEYTPLWFEEEDDVPFMMQVYQIREEKRSLVPAVTHVDGSGRLQTVSKQTNRRYWTLIDIFREITGVPMVLNTSFNENEPVVCRPKEALDCFLRTRMDVLFLGDYVVYRDPAKTVQSLDETQAAPIVSDEAFA